MKEFKIFSYALCVLGIIGFVLVLKDKNLDFMLLSWIVSAAALIVINVTNFINYKNKKK